MIILGSPDDRVNLLKLGYSGKEIEDIYIMINGFEVVNINWLPIEQKKSQMKS